MRHFPLAWHTPCLTRFNPDHLLSNKIWLQALYFYIFFLIILIQSEPNLAEIKVTTLLTSKTKPTCACILIFSCSKPHPQMNMVINQSLEWRIFHKSHSRILFTSHQADFFFFKSHVEFPSNTEICWSDKFLGLGFKSEPRPWVQWQTEPHTSI